MVLKLLLGNVYYCIQHWYMENFNISLPTTYYCVLLYWANDICCKVSAKHHT